MLFAAKLPQADITWVLRPYTSEPSPLKEQSV
ncbi:hypothetical protein ACSSV4_004674 [Roseovarius sp. MBR-154]